VVSRCPPLLVILGTEAGAVQRNLQHGERREHQQHAPQDGSCRHTRSRFIPRYWWPVKCGHEAPIRRQHLWDSVGLHGTDRLPVSPPRVPSLAAARSWRSRRARVRLFWAARRWRFAARRPPQDSMPQHNRRIGSPATVRSSNHVSSCPQTLFPRPLRRMGGCSGRRGMPLPSRCWGVALCSPSSGDTPERRENNVGLRTYRPLETHSRKAMGDRGLTSRTLNGLAKVAAQVRALQNS
jgi:hypothetical protein